MHYKMEQETINWLLLLTPRTETPRHGDNRHNPTIGQCLVPVMILEHFYLGGGDSILIIHTTK